MHNELIQIFFLANVAELNFIDRYVTIGHNTQIQHGRHETFYVTCAVTMQEVIVALAAVAATVLGIGLYRGNLTVDALYPVNRSKTYQRADCAEKASGFHGLCPSTRGSVLTSGETRINSLYLRLYCARCCQ